MEFQYFSGISKTGATRCQILRQKCTKFDFRCGPVPEPAGELTCLPRGTRPLAVFKGRNSKREGKRREGETRGEGKLIQERGGEGAK